MSYITSEAAAENLKKIFGATSPRSCTSRTGLIALYEKRRPQFDASSSYNPDDAMSYFQATYLSRIFYGLTYEDVKKDRARNELIEKLIYSSDQIWKF